MQSATSRLNHIVMFGCVLLLFMSAVNFTHGRLIYNPQPQVNFEIVSIPSFMDTKKWDQLNFRYNLEASN